MGPGAERDQVGELVDRLEVAGAGDSLEPQRVEGVSGEEAQVVVHAGECARLAVVEEVGLADRGERERAVAVRDFEVESVVARRLARVGPQALVDRGHDIGQRAPVRVRAHSVAKASRAASTVRATCSSLWASEGNHASNWEGGG